MAKFTTSVLAFLFWSMTWSCGPDQISEEKSNNQGIKKMIIKTSHGKIYKVESDLQTLTAFQGEDLLWTAEIGKAFDSTIPGKNEIRSIEPDSNGILVMFGKHCFVWVDTLKGTLTNLECD